MSEMWEKDPMEQNAAPAEPVVPAEPVAVAEPEVVVEPTAPAEPAAPAAPEVPVEPAAPQTPPMNGFAPDGSYRYVPPRAAEPTPPPYQAPPQPAYYQPPYAQPTPPPAPAPKKGRGWIVAVAVLASLALIVFGMWSAFAWLDWETDRDKEGTTQTGNNTTGTDTNNNSNQGTGEKEELVITPGGSVDNIDPETDYYYGDGGLSTETIVSKNYHSAVVLTMYMKSGYQYFGESNLQEVGAASGIVWTASGYIITNCHCVMNESTGKAYDRIDVTMYDGTIYENAKVIGADEATDLAVIKVEATDLVPAEFGDSNELAVGARVVALGNAAGLSWTATQGIVSAKARDVYEDTGYAIKCLQVDAPINSGNSGGPLLNKFGQVVAINSAKIAAAGYDGLGFAIPITEAKPILESLLEFGYVKGRVALGITGRTIDNGYYRGFMISEFNNGSCLEGTDAQEGDLIVAVESTKVVDYASLRSALAKYNVGDKVTLTLLRSNVRTGEVTTHYVEVTLKEQTKN